MSNRLLRCAWLAALLVVAAPLAAAPAPQPFSARYQLQVAGWPDVEIRHRLSREAGLWQSEMRAALPGASGRESGRFRLDDQRIQARRYRADYSLLGIRRAFGLDQSALSRVPDRQSALVALARQAADRRCAQPCRLQYLDHRGRTETLDYRHLDAPTLSLPAGRFTAIRVALTEPGKPDRRLVLDLHPELPGLLLGMEYQRDGRRRSRLVLTRLEQP